MYAELEATPDRGPQFAAAIRHLVRWEDSWAAWKQGSCPPAPLERAAAQPPAGSEDADLSASRRCLPAGRPARPSAAPHRRARSRRRRVALRG